MPTIMTQNPYVSTAAITEAPPTRPMCWGAVLAGAVAALSTHLLITLFGIGLGVQLIDPVDAGDAAQKLSIGVGIAWSVSALISLWFGGWVAGRLTPEPSRGLGGLHGLLVWSVATVTVALAFTGSAGVMAGGLAKLAGKTAGATGSALAQASGDSMQQFASANSDLLGSFAQELATPGNAPAGEAPSTNAAVRREVSWALIRFFSLEPGERNAEARNALAQSISRATGMSEADAQARVDGWIASYDQIQRDMAALKDRVAAQAKEAADASAKFITHAAVWTFVAFLIGAIAAAMGGRSGAASRRENDVDAGAPLIRDPAAAPRE
ncbi:MAG: hypothetical protein SFV32_02835 [Opitutaceae bacterium]|nr:hypothetical protein [Opitutaceae bacterium]